MQLRLLSTLMLAIPLLVMSGCARQISSDVYSAGSVGETSITWRGRIVDARQVMIQDKDYLEQNALGGIAGGVVGGVLGNTLGKGTGNTLATIGGVAAGAAAGAAAEQELKKQVGIEYIVELENGASMTVVQGPTPQLAIGQPVYVIKSQAGRSRVVAR